MVTLYRIIRLWQLKIKYKLAIYSLLDEGMKYLSKNRDEIEKKFIHELATIIHNEHSAMQSLNKESK